MWVEFLLKESERVENEEFAKAAAIEREKESKLETPQ